MRLRALEHLLHSHRARDLAYFAESRKAEGPPVQYRSHKSRRIPKEREILTGLVVVGGRPFLSSGRRTCRPSRRWGRIFGWPPVLFLPGGAGLAAGRSGSPAVLAAVRPPRGRRGPRSRSAWLSARNSVWRSARRGGGTRWRRPRSRRAGGGGETSRWPGCFGPEERRSLLGRAPRRRSVAGLRARLRGTPGARRPDTARRFFRPCHTLRCRLRHRLASADRRSGAGSPGCLHAVRRALPAIPVENFLKKPENAKNNRLHSAYPLIHPGMDDFFNVEGSLLASPAGTAR